MEKSMKPAGEQQGGDHYQGLAIQPTIYCQRNRIPDMESHVIRYMTRHASKGKALDVRKAIHFCQMVLLEEYNMPCVVEYPSDGAIFGEVAAAPPKADIGESRSPFQCGTWYDMSIAPCDGRKILVAWTEPVDSGARGRSPAFSVVEWRSGVRAFGTWDNKIGEYFIIPMSRLIQWTPFSSPLSETETREGIE